MRTSIAAVALTAAAFTMCALAFAGVAAAASVAFGGALAAGNLWALARVVAALLPDSRRTAEAQSRGAWSLLAALKMVGLIAVAWLLMRRGIASPLPMLIGFGALPIGIAIGSLVSDRSGQTEDR
jgi:ATP synthase I subunit